MTLGRKYQPSSGYPGDTRRAFASQSKVGSISGCSSSISLCDMIEPPDWEELSERLMNENDPLAYPHDDVEVVTVPKKISTIGHVLPDDDLSNAPLFVRDCIRTYTSNYTVVEHKYRHYSPSTLTSERIAERVDKLLARISNESFQYEIDLEEDSQQPESQSSSGRQSVASISSSSSFNEQGGAGDGNPESWVSVDLQTSEADPLLDEIFDPALQEQKTAYYEARREENQESDFLGLFTPYMLEEDAVERRPPAEVPSQHPGHRLKVTCHQLRLEVDVEPLFASMALYDLSLKKKLSENFYFDLNSEVTRQMLAGHVPKIDVSTLSRTAVFDVANLTSDVFIVVRLEKVLQGDVNECIEPYIKDDKNRDRVRASALAACQRLGAYRMPLAWTAVSFASVFGESDRDSLASTGSNSLDRKASTSSIEALRRVDSLTRSGSIDRRPPPPPVTHIQCPPHNKPMQLTVTTFFKQETDKLRDEDLYKFLAELKRPSTTKKLKTIPGILKIEVAAAPDEIPNCLTPELFKLHPYNDNELRPCKEVLPFPCAPSATAHYQYRNLMFLSVREINLTAFTSKNVSARNITVRIQLMCNEDESAALPGIFGRSSSEQLLNKAYTTVLYHNKNPCLYDEFKLKLPATLGDGHHLLFTFIHVACRRPTQHDNDAPLETVLGYTWLPLCRNGALTRGEFCLPVMMERPPANYSYIFPEVQLPGTKWIDNHKPIFSIVLEPCTTVHPLDSHIERFAIACEAIEEGHIPTRIGMSNMEAELKASIADLPNCNMYALAKHLPTILDKLIRLLVAPVAVAGNNINLGQDVFLAFNRCTINITQQLKDTCPPESHGRSPLIATYIQYQCSIPRAAFTDTDVGLPLTPSVLLDSSCKILHEELVLQWVVASGAARECAMENSWTLFELIVKSQHDYLHSFGAREAARRARFPDQFTDDLSTLVNNIISEIVASYGRNSRLTQSLNNSLAFFLFEQLSIMDRGFVMTLIQSYFKMMNKISDAPQLMFHKISFLRIICSHEHFISLNLPPEVGNNDKVPNSVSSLATSPSHSRASQSSTPPYHALSHDFRSRHYLVGLLLAELTTVLHMHNPELRCACVSALMSLLWSLEADARLTTTDKSRSRVGALFLPLLEIVMDAHPYLYTPPDVDKDLMPLDSDLGEFSQFFTTSPTDNSNHVQKPTFSYETTRNLLICLLWVLKCTNKAMVSQSIAHLSPAKVYTLLHILDIAFACTEYKGRKEILKCAQQNVRTTTEIKAKLEDVILGQGSARSELIMRRKGVCASGMSGMSGVSGVGERWRKESACRGGGVGVGVGNSVCTRRVRVCVGVCAAASHYAAITALHLLHVLLKTCTPMEFGAGVSSAALHVLVRAILRQQSERVLEFMFASLRELMLKAWWGSEGECAARCGGVAAALVRRACGAAHTRTHAAATLYLLMRHLYNTEHNFGLVKMQVTMGVPAACVSRGGAASLRVALRTVLQYADTDTHMHRTTFTQQVKELVFNLHMILSDTARLARVQHDPELLQELMVRVATGYRHSPPLRLTWLNNLAHHHIKRGNHTEAGMCLCHGAALVAESRDARGAALLQRVTHNVRDEALHHHSLHHHSLQALLEHAANELMAGGMYETVNEVYKILIPIAEKNRDYKKLANLHGKLNECFTRIEQLHGKRVLATYFRVGFYGSRFGDMNSQQYIYKEHALTKLTEICTRLENFYSQRFGAENLVIIKESNNVDVQTLDPHKAYIQITYVEPYLEPHELRKRLTYYERNYNINRFMYATPFTVGGRAHGDLAEQCKRKTILTTAKHFPYLNTRIQVVQRTQIILTPIEVAIEDIQKKTCELAAATIQEPPNPKMLQMVVQGCIGTTVNQGPLQLAQVFLAPVADGLQPPTILTNKLRLAFKDFSKKCHDALKKNKHLIGSDQREYQRELERNLSRFNESLAPLIKARPEHIALLTNGGAMHKAEYRNVERLS